MLYNELWSMYKSVEFGVIVVEFDRKVMSSCFVTTLRNSYSLTITRSLPCWAIALPQEALSR